MKKVCIIIATFIAAVGIANGAVRNENSIPRNTQRATTSRTASNTKKVSARTTSKQGIARPAVTQRKAGTSARNARTVNTVRNTTTPNTARTATTKRLQPQNKATTNSKRPARAATITPSTPSNTFNSGYNVCREAYFTCMDQFCANANDTYRRCVCSSKLTEIQSRERALGQTSEQIINFKNLNLDIINKTASEVTAMLSATAGEYAQANSNDKSDSAKQLAGISEVLSNTKSKSLSTQGTLDIAGDINSIWATSDLAGSANIANLTGEALYNAVHAQCSELVANKCSSDAIQTMVTTAYGMYIENDCSAIINTLDKQKQSASGTIRQTEREMQLARLENYQSHNSTSINECIAQVRADITADTACGPDYIHCLDVTGLYLNRETGEPIYTQNFYQLETMTSLAGDVLTNQPNRLLVAELNRKREFASRGLDTCRDISDAVWDEFLRQAISEIYQGQQKRVRQVKNECIEIVNKCYDEKNQSLKDFSNIKEQLLLGQRMELSEQLCQEKMDACSNLYGGGPNGLSELLVAMHNITNQSISNQCLATLREYTKEYCAVPGNDTLHLYPYACRVYNPGDARYASVQECNSQIDQKEQEDNNANTEQTTENIHYRCEKKYRKCKGGYYLNKNNKCYTCPLGYESICNSNTTGVTYADIYNNTSGVDCGTYVGSLYHKLARYATQACIRPSESNKTLPATVLQDINVIMDEIRRNMAQELARECERLGGEWVDSIWVDSNADNLHDSYKNYKHKKFYDSTSSNTDWGYCSTSTPDTTTYILTLKNNNYWDESPSNAQTIKHGCKIATPAETKLIITKGTTPPALTDDQIPTCQTPNDEGKTCTFKSYTSEDCMGNTYFNGKEPNTNTFETTTTSHTIEACWECK